ncbi:MAG: 4-hydroxyphenylacetate 3-hydroxylase [Oscillospiraceae bacterium]|nr:4-hydroxyphenylacetate 3-hydroxylase [Oscillospiraceae bacterium]
MEMFLKTREEYQKEVRAMRKNVWKDGHWIEDLFTEPSTCRMMELNCYKYDMLNDPECQPLMTAKSEFGDYKVARWLTIKHSAEDCMMSSKMKRLIFDNVGTCAASACTGWNAMQTIFAVGYDCDKEYGTHYYERITNWLKKVEKTACKVAGALTDAKGTRLLGGAQIGQQADPDVCVHKVAEDEKGIYVTGAKIMIAHAASAHWLFIVPGYRYNEENKEYAVAFAVPRDAEGVTLIQTDIRDNNIKPESWDDMRFNDHCSWIIFDNCFIPHEHVFQNGEAKYSDAFVTLFTANYRSEIGGCVAGQGDMMIGAAVVMNRANGLPDKVIQDKITDIMMINNMFYGIGLGALLDGWMHECGIWFANPNVGHSNKYWIGKYYAEQCRILQDIGGGIAETGCMPNYTDCTSPEMGPTIMKYIKANPAVSAETRARAVRLCEWLEYGNGFLAFIHGGSSPDGAKMVVRSCYDLEYLAKKACFVAGIDEVPAPVVKGK